MITQPASESLETQWLSRSLGRCWRVRSLHCVITASPHTLLSGCAQAMGCPRPETRRNNMLLQCRAWRLHLAAIHGQWVTYCQFRHCRSEGVCDRHISIHWCIIMIVIVYSMVCNYCCMIITNFHVYTYISDVVYIDRYKGYIAWWWVCSGFHW